MTKGLSTLSLISITWFWECWISRTHFGRLIDINDMVSGVLISRTLFQRVIIKMTWFWESWISRTLFGRVLISMIWFHKS